MALLTIEGVYEDGKIELAEKPADVQRARVMVTFLPESQLTEEQIALRRQEAGKRLLATMKEGINFGGWKFNREEIYEERMRQLEERRGR
jgi:hypothetical protein